MRQTLQPKTAELSKKDIVKIPTIIKNKVLMAPGPWNGVHYTAEEIRKAYENTNWKDKDVISVILDHADKPLSVHDWVGWVRNPRMVGDNLVGDLELYDENIIIKLLKAKAKFGISPRVKGIEHNNEFRNFTFENFSIVTNPAVKKAYINLSQNKLKGGKMTEKELQEETEEGVEEEPTEVAEDTSEEETSESEEESETTEKTEELSKKKKKKYPYPYKEKKSAAKKKKYPYPEEGDEEEMSDEEYLEITTMSAWTDFVKKMKKKYPKMPFKAIAAAFKKSKKADEELEELSEEELIEKIEQLTNILRRKKKYEALEQEEKSTEERLAEIEKKVKELAQEPNPQSIVGPTETTKELASIYSAETQHHTPGVLAMTEYLKSLK